MPDKKLSTLLAEAEDAAPQATDVAYGVHDPAGTALSKAVRWWRGVLAGLVPPPAASGAGVNVRVKGQDAAAGNNAGGAVVLEPGVKAGTGLDGVVLVRAAGGVPTDHDIAVYHDGSNGRLQALGGGLRIAAASGYSITLETNGEVVVPSGVLRARGVPVTRNVMTGSVTLSAATDSGEYFFLDPGGADRDVTAWASPVKGDSFSVKHVGSVDAITVRTNAGVAIGVALGSGDVKLVIFDGVNWEEN